MDEDVAAVETEKEEMKADENTEDQEEDEQEKTLTPAQHLELLRETELALFKATFNHKKVRKRGEVALKYAYWLAPISFTVLRFFLFSSTVSLTHFFWAFVSSNKSHFYFVL